MNKTIGEQHARIHIAQKSAQASGFTIRLLFKVQSSELTYDPSSLVLAAMAKLKAHTADIWFPRRAFYRFCT